VKAIVLRTSDSKPARRAELVIANYLLDHGVKGRPLKPEGIIAK
jgi:hypothetical protein